MDLIKTHAFTNTAFVTHLQKRSIECRVNFATEARQVKIVCEVPHLYNLFSFRPVTAHIFSKSLCFNQGYGFNVYGSIKAKDKQFLSVASDRGLCSWFVLKFHLIKISHSTL